MAKLLWSPSEEKIKNSNMYRFMNYINDKFNQNFTEYDPLYQWSIDNIPKFWESIWDFIEVKASIKYDQVIDELNKTYTSTIDVGVFPCSPLQIDMNVI